MSKIQKFIAVASFLGALIALILGTIGFYQLRHQGERSIAVSSTEEMAMPAGDLGMNGAPAGEEINQTLRLFTGNADFREMKSGLSLLLYLATILAYGSVLSGAGLVCRAINRLS